MVAAICRFYLGRSVTLYELTIAKDPLAKRPDTVDTLRNVLHDVTEAVALVNKEAVHVREELYWTVYNASLTALRIARWLRLKGFGGVCVKPLWWLAQTMHCCVPMMAVHLVPYRTRFLAEVFCCVCERQVSLQHIM